MSRVAVRQAVTDYLNNAQIPGVGIVYATRNYVNEQDYEQRIVNGQIIPSQTASGTGCVLIVNLPTDRRQRRADTGRGAVNDENTHGVVVELWAANPGGDPQILQEDYDTIVDGIFKAIRADATLNAPGTVWSAGEYEAGIDHEQSSPYTGADGMTVLIVGSIRFDAIEWEAGSAGT